MDNKYTKFRNIYLIVLSIVVVASILIGCYIHLSGHHKSGLFTKKTSKSGSIAEMIDIKDNFEDIDIDVDIADITFEYGDSYTVSYNYKDYEAPTVEVKNNTLLIKEKASNTNFSNANQIDCSITITIPEATKLSDIEIKAACGNIEFDDIECDDLTLFANLGNIELSGITCNDLTVDADCGSIEFNNSTMNNIKANADMGAIEFAGVTFDNADMKADMGAIEVSGTFNALTAKCDLGAIEVKTTKPVDDVDLDLKASLGSVTVNGKEW